MEIAGIDIRGWLILLSFVFPVIPGVILCLVIAAIIGIVKLSKRVVTTDYTHIDHGEHRRGMLKKLEEEATDVKRG